MKKTILATSIAALAGLAVSGQAAASVYGGSALVVDNLVIAISDDGGATPGGATIDSFNFQIVDTASLNGSALVGNTATCGGDPGVPGAGTNNCGLDPALDIQPANAPGGTVTRTNNTFIIYGPGTDEYANSDNVIWSAQLTGDATSHTTQIAEAEIQGGETGSSNSEIQSTTGFTFEFTVEGANTLYIDFDSIAYVWAEINDPTGINQLAKANISLEFSLSNDVTGDILTWRPNGAAGGCVATFGTCTELYDTFDLQTDVQTSTDGTTAADSRFGSGAHAILFTGLYDGDWTFGIEGITSVLVSRQQVPVPAPLALLGIGLLGLGAVRRRWA